MINTSPHGHIQEEYTLPNGVVLDQHIFFINDKLYSTISKFYMDDTFIIQITIGREDGYSRVEVPTTQNILQSINKLSIYVELADFIWNEIPRTYDRESLRRGLLNQFDTLRDGLNS